MPSLQTVLCIANPTDFAFYPSLQRVRHGAGAIWELHELAGRGKGQRGNCLLLDTFLQDIMRTLDNQGRALADTDQLRLANLLELIEAAIELVQACNKPGMPSSSHSKPGLSSHSSSLMWHIPSTLV